jgi:MoaA/NifB/PqqE/SkfB family radical SAM enzyme
VRTERVVTNETCNQNCWFCNARRPAERTEFIARRAVRKRIAAAHAGDAREIVLSGGEPTMRSDLVDLVQRAAEGGRRVVLETNGALIDAERARALAAAGLHTARVQVLAGEADAADAIARVPGAFAAALTAIRALLAARVTVEVTTPIVRRNHALVAAVPGALALTELRVAALVLVIPTDAPDPIECATLADVARAVTAVAESARRAGMALRLDAATYIPPCLFDVPERVAHLFALNRGNDSRGGFRRVSECDVCLVNDRCPGLPDGAWAREPHTTVHPIREHRMRRRLTVMSTVEEQVERELVSRQIVRGGYGVVPEYTVRVNFHCNQSCDFCFVSTHLPPAGDAAVRAAIQEAGREEAVLVLSGGEPTMNPRLLDYVRLAKQAGVRGIELQTNATRLNTTLADALVDAGVEQMTVSLHASTAELSDAITGAPGTFVQTLRGLDALAPLSVRVQLNFVFCQANRDDFPNVVALVAARWPRAGITPIFVGSHTDVVPRTNILIPSFSDILPPLTSGLERARAAGIDVGGLDTMCGLPLCLVPPSERDAFSSVPLPPDAGDGEFVKGDACGTCTESHRCYGVRRGYAELYGTAELRPFTAHSELSTAL